MARDDRLKKAQSAGADFLETARAKAEEFLRELAKAGGDTQGRAQGAIDDLVVGGRKSTEQFMATVRKEVETQLSALGLATKSDLAALEARLRGRTAATAAKQAPAKKAPAAKKTAAARSTAASKASTAKKAPAKKAPAAKKTAAKKTAG
ncbi:MAG TPA: hypothetical protein VFH70_12820 [Acidimicrobiales bacterium]|nr:hypothetical protein [Acidimicrobiales bacterium]